MFIPYVLLPNEKIQTVTWNVLVKLHFIMNLCPKKLVFPLLPLRITIHPMFKLLLSNLFHRFIGMMPQMLLTPPWIILCQPFIEKFHAESLSLILVTSLTSPTPIPIFLRYLLFLLSPFLELQQNSHRPSPPVTLWIQHLCIQVPSCRISHLSINCHQQDKNSTILSWAHLLLNLSQRVQVHLSRLTTDK